MAYPQGSASVDMTSGIYGSDFSPDTVVGGLINNRTALNKAGFRNSLGYQISLVQNFVNEEFLGRYSNSITSGFLENIRGQESSSIHLGIDFGLSGYYNYISDEYSQNHSINTSNTDLYSGIISGPGGMTLYNYDDEYNNTIIKPGYLEIGRSYTAGSNVASGFIIPDPYHLTTIFASDSQMDLRPGMDESSILSSTKFINVYGNLLFSSGNFYTQMYNEAYTEYNLIKNSGIQFNAWVDGNICDIGPTELTFYKSANDYETYIQPGYLALGSGGVQFELEHDLSEDGYKMTGYGRLTILGTQTIMLKSLGDDIRIFSLPTASGALEDNQLWIEDGFLRVNI